MKFVCKNRESVWVPAIAVLALTLFLFVTGIHAQDAKPAPQATPSSPQLDPPPPPLPPLLPKPSPTPRIPPDEEYEVIRISSNLVVVPVSVTDADGQPVLGLKADNFRLQEEGREQQIAQIGDPEQVPLDIALLLDVSSSVSARFDFEQQAAARFLKQVLKPVDRATIFAIDSEPRLEQARATAEVASGKMMNIKAATGPSPTAFYDTVVAAARYLTKNTPDNHRRVIVVITDGEDNYSDLVRDAALAAYSLRESDGQDSSPAGKAKLKAATTAALKAGHHRAQLEVQREVQSANAVFYSINPSGEALKLNIISTRGQEGMQQLADATGGSAFVPEAAGNLDGVFQRIAAELRAQYLLQYYSADESTKGKFLHIKVTVPSRPELHIRAREGYYVTRK